MSTNDAAAWRFETTQVHARRAARPDHGCPCDADLQDDVVRVRELGPRPRPVRARAAGQHLLADHEPDERRRRAADRRARGRHRGAARVLGAGGGDVRGAQHRGCRRPHRVVVVDLRRHVQPVQVHAREARHRDHLRRGPGRRRGVAPRGPAEHEAVLRGDHRQPAHQRARHHEGVRRRARGRRAPDRRQHHRDAVPDPSVRARRGHRGALGDEVPRRPRHGDRRRDRRRRPVRLVGPRERFPEFNSPDPSTTAPCSRRPWATSSRTS